MHTQTALVKDVVKGDTGSVVVETCRSVYRTVEGDWGENGQESNGNGYSIYQ